MSVKVSAARERALFAIMAKCRRLSLADLRLVDRLTAMLTRAAGGDDGDGLPLKRRKRSGKVVAMRRAG
jgi:hypothetical protein